MKKITSIFLFLFIAKMSFAAEFQVTGTDPQILEQFGFSCAIGDSIMFIGSQKANGGTGSVFLFTQDAGMSNSWTVLMEIVASDAQNGDRFGRVIHLDGDYLIVGAFQENNLTGAAYVFYRNEGGTDSWGEQAKLVAGDATTGDEFGISVSISGNDALVGAYKADLADTLDTGAAYIFNKDQGGTNNWGQTNKLVASDYYQQVDTSTYGTDDWFGYSVAISGDYCVVGAWQADEYGSDSLTAAHQGDNSGAVYFYRRDEGGSGNWGELVKRTPDIDGLAHLGFAVDMDDEKAVVGCPGDNDVYFFHRDQGGVNNWGQVTKVAKPLPKNSGPDAFGESVAISGDFVLVGDPNDDNSGVTGAGAGFSMAFNGSTWELRDSVFASDGATDDFFGTSVAINNNYSVAGAPFVGVNVGAAYVYENIEDLALPVFLNSFAANVNKDGVELSWVTQSEIENLGFELFRSEGLNGNFEEISSYKTNDGLIGQLYSSFETKYSFLDNNIEKNKTYYYRLVDISIRGVRTEHGTVKITTHNNQLPDEITLLKSYPNPFNPLTTISIEATAIYNQDRVELLIYNSLGQKIKDVYKGNMSNGNYLFKWNARNDLNQQVTSGTYFVIFRNISTNFTARHKITYIK